MGEDAQGRNIDELYKRLKVWGRYQLSQLVLVQSLTVPACFQLYIYMYLGYQPPLRCQSVLNLTCDYHIYWGENITIDTDYKKKCPDVSEYNNNTLVKEKCDSGYDYNAVRGATIVTEWDLVCDHSYLASLSQTAFVVGQGIGATLFTILADRFGRKVVCLSSQWMMLAVSLGTVFVPNIFVFIGLRVPMGAIQQGLVMSIGVMPLEILPRSWRGISKLINGLMWTSTLCILCGLAYVFKDTSWRYFQLATVAGSVITLIPNMLFLDESLRWLLANGRTEEARRIIDKATKLNGVNPKDIQQVAEECFRVSQELKTVTYNADEISDQKNKQLVTKKRHTVLDIFRHPKLRISASIMLFSWTVNAGTSFGLSLTAAKLSGNRFLNYFLINIATLPAAFVAYITMQRIGRRFISIVSHFIAGGALLSAAMINGFIGPSGWVTGLTVVGKFGISMSWGTLFQYTPELFPTNLRSVGLGISSSAARIGGMLAPFAAIVIDYHPWLPGTLYGGCCLGVACLIFALPETVDKELPQTMEELNDWKKKKERYEKNDRNDLRMSSQEKIKPVTTQLFSSVDVTE